MPSRAERPCSRGIALITPPAGEAFENGDGVAGAQTVGIAKGVIPSNVSTAVNLAWAKK